MLLILRSMIGSEETRRGARFLTHRENQVERNSLQHGSNMRHLNFGMSQVGSWAVLKIQKSRGLTLKFLGEA